MHQRSSGATDRAETKAAKDAERQRAAATVWAEIDAALRERDARTERLRAARLARDARQPG